jgi:hypothetical protein
MLLLATALLLAAPAPAPIFPGPPIDIPIAAPVALRVVGPTGYALTQEGELVVFQLYRRQVDGEPLLLPLGERPGLARCDLGSRRRSGEPP